MRLFVLILLTGCVPFYAVGPSTTPELKEYDIKVRFYETIEDINKVCGMKQHVIGCSRPELKPCPIYVMPNDWLVFIHEIQHCLHGRFHN